MEWFKMQKCWGSSFMKLTDEEAGRLIKAVYEYVDRRVVREGSGREMVLLPAMAEILQRDIELYETSQAEAQRRREEKKQHYREAAINRWKAVNGKQSENGGPVQAEEDSVRFIHKNQNKNKNQNTESEPEGESEEESEPEGEEDVGAEQSSLPAGAGTEIPGVPEDEVAVCELPVAEIPLVDGSVYPVYRKEADGYLKLYPAVDVDQALRNMQGWCLGNPKKRKTRSGIRRFINRWLSEEQNRGGAGQNASGNPYLAAATGYNPYGKTIFD